MGLLGIFKNSNLEKENQELKDLIKEIGGTDVLAVKERLNGLNKEVESVKEQKQKIITTLESEIESSKRKKQEIESEISKLNSSIKLMQSQVLSLEDSIMMESFALYKPHFEFENSEKYKEELDRVRETEKSLIKNGTAAVGSTTWTVNGNAKEGQKMVKDTIKLILRSFNNECDYCVDHVKFNNIELNEKRIRASFEALNKLGKIMSISISNNFLGLKLNELHLAHEYQVKKQEEKEEIRRIKEEQREQQKLEKELKEARERVEKERKHYSKAIKDIEMRISTATDEVEIQSLMVKKEELSTRLGELTAEEKELDYREQNAKAGYVYVISNIGAFGEGIFKIGMTRRLDPMERIIELGDASVPFPFDVHALIFSDNAPDLEAKIQNHFDRHRLNKINIRREFFKANVDEVEQVIRKFFEKTLDFTKIPLAEQYRESIKMT